MGSEVLAGSGDLSEQVPHELDVATIVVGIDKWKRNTEKFYRKFRNHNPEMPLVIIDNASPDGYPGDLDDWTLTLRLNDLVGYAEALNVGLLAAGDRDWYLCFNNDNNILGPFMPDVEKLNERVLYGSEWNFDECNHQMLTYSAWLLISREVLTVVGYFDPLMRYAFEDFDYEQRALKNGFGLSVAYLPVEHTDKHTRYKVKHYFKGWRESARIYGIKHKQEIVYE